MATLADSPDDGDIEHLDRASRKLEAEARKLLAEARKLNAEEYKLAAEERKLHSDKMLSPWLLLAQGLIAGAAIMGASVALVKFLLEH